jgi:hypothetical protein
VPIIAQRGEEVLSRSDPRNAANGGGGGRASQNIKIINAIDSASVVRQGLSAPGMEKVILNVFRANRAAFKQVFS